MAYLDTARQSIARTIDELHKSGSDAFAAGDIDDSARIGSWIKVLQKLVSTDPVPAGSSSATVSIVSVSNAGVNTDPVAAPKPSRLSRGGKGAYPRFYRSRDNLVKVGWSKTEKAEYEHKAPWETIEAAGAAVAGAGAAGRQFTANDLFAQPAVANLPQYQVYLAMAWFRSAGLVEQIGKQGYRCGDSESLENVVRDLWQEIADRR